MFDKLSSRLSAVVEGLRGRGRLTEENIADTLRQVRMALLEADVALPVVKTFIDARQGARRRSGGPQEPDAGPGAVSIIHEELVRVMGEGVRPLNLRVQPPAVILLAGLQGAGKTTTAAKLALLAARHASASACCSRAPTSTGPRRSCSSQRLGEQLDDRRRAGERRRRHRSRSRGARARRGAARRLRRADRRHRGPPARRRGDDGRGARARRAP